MPSIFDIETPIANLVYTKYKELCEKIDKEIESENKTHLYQSGDVSISKFCIDNRNVYEVRFGILIRGSIDKNDPTKNDFSMRMHCFITQDEYSFSSHMSIYELNRSIMNWDDLKLKYFQTFENVCLEKMKKLKFCKFLGRYTTPEKMETRKKYMDFIKHEDCAVCLEPTIVQTKCDHFVCVPCAEKIIKNHKNRNMKCPVCRRTYHTHMCDCVGSCETDDDSDEDD